MSFGKKTAAKKKRVLVVGISGARKSTMIKALTQSGEEVRKTQTVRYLPEFGDIPGEYLDYRFYYGTLQVVSTDFSCIVLVLPSDARRPCFPRGFAAMFGSKKVFEVVSKADLVPPVKAREELQRAGASPIFEVSAQEGSGLQALAAYLDVLS